ncbi:MAG: VOC family protein [Gluconacetobacter sp.]
MTSNGLPRGIDHVGMTVPDLEAASTFFVNAFGAVPLYDNLKRTQPPFSGPDTEKTLGLVKGTQVVAMRMMRLGNGASLELFEMQAPEQAKPARASDLGLQHLAVYVDDIQAGAKRFTDAGGVLLTEPGKQLGIEEGKGNFFCYGRTPWGMTIELLCTPDRSGFDTIEPQPRYIPPPR